MKQANKKMDELLNQLYNSNIMIVAGAETGKTYLSKVLFEIFPSHDLYFDTMNKFPDESIDLEDYSFNRIMYELLRVDLPLPENENYYIKQVFHGSDDVVDQFLYFISEELIKRPMHKIIRFWVDEIQRFMSKYKMNDSIRNLFTHGRNQRSFIAGMTQRPQEVNNTALTQSTLLLGNLSEQDIEYFRRNRFNINFNELQDFRFKVYRKIEYGTIFYEIENSILKCF